MSIVPVRSRFPILPCPFCAAKHFGRVNLRNINTKALTWHVVCGDEKCGAIGPGARIWPDAVRLWNGGGDPLPRAPRG